MVLSLFFSVTSALVSTLIQQWAREYLQYSQPSAAPHKRGRMRAYLHDGLIRFQMKRLTYGVPVLLHLSVFLFFYAISEWLYSINVPVGATARYCLVALLAVYLALSVLPLIVRNAPYQTALTTPLRACVSLVQVSYIGICQLVRCSSKVYEDQKGSGLFKSIHIDRARALMQEIKKRASELDRSAMHWLLQELDEDNMDTFLSGLPGYIHSPLMTDKSLVVEGLIKDGVPGRIREHITTCLRSLELSPEESMSRASACINSLRLISETAANTAVRRPSIENDDIRAIMEYLEPLCFQSSTALRASSIRGLVIREFLIPFANLSAEELRTKRFPDYLIPLYRVTRVWKTTEITQWSHLTGILTATGHPLPSDQEMWADVVYDGPLINLTVLSYALLWRVGEGNVKVDMAWKTIEILLKSLGLAQVRASALTLARLDEVLIMARAGNPGYEGGRSQITPLLKTLDIVISGLRLAEAFAHTSKPVLSLRQIEAIFGPEQLRNSELLETFAANLPGFVRTSTPDMSKSLMERLILEDKLWEQLHSSLSTSFDPQLPFPDQLRIMQAFFDIFDVAFEVLKESSVINWLSQDLGLNLLYVQARRFDETVVPGKFIGRAAYIHQVVFEYQYSHALLTQFSINRSRGEGFALGSLNDLRTLLWYSGVGERKDVEMLTDYCISDRTRLDAVIKADEIIRVAIHDGPLSIFCRFGMFTFDMLASDAQDLTSEDTKRVWKTLERMLDSPQLPLINASGEIWVRFDHLRALVRDRVILGGNSQIVERLRPRLDIIEKVVRMRPPADERAERTGNAERQSHADDSVSPDAWPPEGTPIFGSSREVEVSRLAAGLGGPSDQGPFHPVLVTGPTTRTDTFTSFGWTPQGQSNLVVNGPSAFSIPTTQPGFGAETPVPSAYPPYVPQIHPQNFAMLHGPQVYPGSSAFSDVARRGNPANLNDLRARAHAMQSVPANNPVVPWLVLSNPYTSPPSGSGLINVLSPGDAEQHNPNHGDESGGLTPEFNAGDGTYLLICLRPR